MTDRIPPYNDQPTWPAPAVGHPAPSQPSTPPADATMRAIEAWSAGQRRAREDVFMATAEREQSIRCDAIGHAIAALGDSALTHDGWLRPRVFELADQIADYIADGSTP